MADNQYRRYLNDEERHRSSSVLMDTVKTVAKGALVVGGVVAAGRLAYEGIGLLNDSGVLGRGLSRLNSRFSYINDFMTGLNKTFQEEGIGRTLLGEAQDALRNNLTDTFRNTVVGGLRSARGNDLMGVPTQIEKFIEKVGRDRQKAATSAINSVRYEAIKEAIKGKDWSANPELADAIDNLLSTDQSILKAGFEKNFARESLANVPKMKPETREKVIDSAINNALERSGIHKKFGNEPSYSGVVGDLRQIIKDYSDRKAYGAQGRLGKKVKEQTQILKNIADQENIRQYQRRTAGSLAMQAAYPNFRPLTVGEAVRRGIFDVSSTTTVPVSRNGRLVKYMRDPMAGLKFVNELDKNGKRKFAATFDDLIVDPSVFVNEYGEVMDFRAAGIAKSKTLKTLANNFQIPLLNIKPFKMFTVFNKQPLEDAPFHIFNRENIRPILPMLGKNLPEDDYYFVQGSIFNKAGQRVASNMRLAKGNFGIYQRELAAIAGYTRRPPVDGSDVLSNIGRFFDIGNQEYESDIAKKLSGLTKLWDSNWERNMWDNLKEGRLVGKLPRDKAAYVSEAYRKFVNTADNMTTGLSSDTVEAFKDHIDPEIYRTLTQNTREEGVVGAIYRLLNGDNISKETRHEFEKVINKYESGHLGDIVRTTRRGYQPDLPEMLESLQINTTEAVTGLDQAEKLLHMELIDSSQDLQKGVTVGSLVKDMLNAGDLSQRQADEILDLYVLNDVKKFGERGRLTSSEGANRFLGFISHPSGESQGTIRDHLEKMIYDANPMIGVGPGETQASFFPGNEYLPMRKGGVSSTIRKTIFDINNILRDGGNIFDVSTEQIGAVGRSIRDMGADIIHELGFGSKSLRAGRDNLDQVTSTTVKAYHYFFRLNEGISKLGIGLSNENMGSAQDIAVNLFTRRILGPLAVVMGLGYLNYEAGNVTGEKPTQTVGKAYAQMTMDMQFLKDITGLNAIGKSISRALPGADLLNENPLGMALKFGTFGLIGENRSYEEMKDYYEKGYDPVRKGRFWGIGSNTPFYGDRISYFAPSWYRKMMGEPKFTDSLYGSEGEYWANSWFPNPRNMFGVKPFLDPYHWENKHKEDRPYPVSGGTAFRDIPIVGPLIDMPISAVVKRPRKYPGLQRAHEDYLAEINERYKSFTNEANQGAMLQIYPGGRITPVSNTGEGSVYGVGGDGTGTGGDGTGVGYGPGTGGGTGSGDGMAAVIDPSMVMAYNRASKQSSGRSRGRGASMAQAQLSYTNQNYVQYSNIKPIDGRSISLLRDHTYVDSLDKAMDPNSLAYRLGETAYSLTEIGGMYGFILNTVTGLEDWAAPRTQLQSSSRMYGLQRTFWDQNLGGMGGELSEIYRRFLPHKRNQIKEYNPLQNTMPTWMPGLDYFVDFKHGDPYVKIPEGEGRLPGPGYEAINKLHPDAIFGRYGALDRFKILADVAPWSQQYKYYDSVISKMNTDGLISPEDYEDVQEMREMVSQRKEKYDLYPYRYKYAGNIDRQTVTVARMIDATTFVTEEFPGAPIRLAGIKLPAKDTEQYQEIISELQQYLKPGNKIKIGLESDPLTRTNDDTMNTMSAVVYDEWGQPIQGKLARKFKTVKADYEDNSATTVNALHGSAMITFGKVWESIAHLDTPIHTKFFKVRSPLEHYERQMLYGKDWQSWTHPFRDWIGLTVDKLASGNPLISTGVGALIGSLFVPRGKMKLMGAIIGGAIGGGASSLATFRQAIGRLGGRSDYTWIPKRRRQEREIEEYFDMLKYAKYKGLYEKARQLAISNEGIDPEAISEYSKGTAGANKEDRRKLESIKRWLKINDTGDPDTKQTIKNINARLEGVAGSKVLMNAGPMTMRALQYKAEYEATLYGADPYGDLQVIYRALPKKDRPFFKYFMVATPEEREKILRLVPDNQRRLYQAKWGLKLDDQKTIESYFATHYLPDASWEGWRPGVSLESVKLKFVEHTALDVGEFGFWEDDKQYARNAPEVPSIRKNILGTLDISSLQQVLNGAGIQDVDVQITTDTVEKPDGLFNINMNMNYDRRQDVNNAINENMAYLLA
jgi:hypothetical protein